MISDVLPRRKHSAFFLAHDFFEDQVVVGKSLVILGTKAVELPADYLLELAEAL